MILFHHVCFNDISSCFFMPLIWLWLIRCGKSKGWLKCNLDVSTVFTGNGLALPLDLQWQWVAQGVAAGRRWPCWNSPCLLLQHVTMSRYFWRLAHLGGKIHMCSAEAEEVGCLRFEVGIWGWLFFSKRWKKGSQETWINLKNKETYFMDIRT